MQISVCRNEQLKTKQHELSKVEREEECACVCKWRKKKHSQAFGGIWIRFWRFVWKFLFIH